MGHPRSLASQKQNCPFQGGIPGLLSGHTCLLALLYRGVINVVTAKTPREAAEPSRRPRRAAPREHSMPPPPPPHPTAAAAAARQRTLAAEPHFLISTGARTEECVSWRGQPSSVNSSACSGQSTGWKYTPRRGAPRQMERVKPADSERLRLKRQSVEPGINFCKHRLLSQGVL